MNTTDARKLVYKFAELPTHLMVIMARKLKVLPRNYLKMNSVDLSNHIFRLAKKKKQINRMWELMFPAGQP